MILRITLVSFGERAKNANEQSCGIYFDHTFVIANARSMPHRCAARL
jgi:hypothetical protein